MTEQRIQVSPLIVRTPDLSVVTAGPQPDVFTDPPRLVIEILSPGDSCWDTEERAVDYRRMGIGTVWIVNPKTRSGRMCIGDTWRQASRLEVSGTPVHVDLDAIFNQVQTPAEAR